MTGQEILVYLINRGIVHNIGDEYFPTSEVDRLTANLCAPTLDIKEPKSIEVNSLYPETIRAVSDDKKLVAVLDYCKVPSIVNEGSSQYLVRSTDVTTSNAMLTMLQNPDINPKLLLECIEDYYSMMEYPKSFRNFLSQGDLADLYQSYELGKKLKSNDKPDNKIWG